MTEEIKIKKTDLVNIIAVIACITALIIGGMMISQVIKTFLQDQDTRIAKLENQSKLYDYVIAKLINSTQTQNQINNYLNERINVLNETENKK